ncbi:MAG: VOC family protein [Reyranellaceae bacterium]
MAFGNCKLGYLAIETREPGKWRTFNDTLLKLPAAANPDGSVGLQIDDRRQRLIILPGQKDDVHAVGLELDSDAALDALAERLAGSGTTTRAGDATLCAARGVRRLIGFDDPAGVRLEAFIGLAPAAAPFASEFFADGFHSDDSGFGHVVLATRDLEKSELFYCGVLGFAVTERLALRLGPIDMRGIFLHCNRRHHSIAIFAVPGRRKLHHVMLQAAALRDVGLAYERFKSNRVPFSLHLGQHPDPDSTVSFYAATPSGFDIEIGAAGNEIEPAGWQERRLDRVSSWGHKPTLRLKLNSMRELIAGRLGRH